MRRGKGFAVVAGEVKELAKQTANATEEIGAKILAIQSSAHEVVEAISKITTIINQVSDSQTSIATAVEQQSTTTGEMGRSGAQAALHTTQIAHSAVQVAQAAKASSDGAVETQRLPRASPAWLTSCKLSSGTSISIRQRSPSAVDRPSTSQTLRSGREVRRAPRWSRGRVPVVALRSCGGRSPAHGKGPPMPELGIDFLTSLDGDRAAEAGPAGGAWKGPSTWPGWKTIRRGTTPP